MHDPAAPLAIGAAPTPSTSVLSILWRRKLQILAIMLAVLAPVPLVNRHLPRLYQAETTLVIHHGGENLSPTDILHASLDRAFLLDLVEEIRSRSVAEHVLGELPPWARLRLLSGWHGPASQEEYLVQQVQRAVQPELVRETDVIRVRARARDAQLAAEVANAVAAVLGKRNLDTKRAELSGLRQFIEAQIDTASRQLRDSEEHLNQFKQGNGVVTLQKEAESILERITKVESELHLAATDLTGKRQELAALAKELKRQRQDMPSASSELTSPYIAELKRNMVELQMRYTKLQMQDYAPGHPELVKIQREIDATRTRIEMELRQLAATSELRDPMNSIPLIVQRQIDLQIATTALDAKVKALSAVRDDYERSMASFPNKELVVMRLTRSNMLNEKIYMMLLEKREETRIAEAGRIGNVRVLDAATPPRRPVQPRPMLNLCLAGILGLLLGTSVAVHRQLGDATVTCTRDLRRLPGLKLLGCVPRMPRGRDRAVHADAFPLVLRGNRVRTLPAPAPAGEAYRSLRTSLHHASADGLPRLVLVTSPGPREGKSTTALNLAVGLALSGVPTCLLDADMRRPVLHRALGLELGPGLADCLEAGAPQALVEQRTGYEHLMLVSAGRSKRNPAELLEAPVTAAVLERLQQRHRVVIVDSPPVIPVTDQAILAQHVDIVLLVLYAGSTRLDAVEHAVHTLRVVGPEPLHAVINGLAAADYYGKYSRYYRYYREDKSSGARRASA